MSTASIVAGKYASTTGPVNHATGAETNLFAHESHSIGNAYHFDHEDSSIQGQTPTSFSGRAVKFTIEKFNDCFKEGHFKIVTNAAAGATTEAFINYYGYFAIQKMGIKLTNNNYTPINEIAYWKFDCDRVRYNSRQWIGYKQENQLMGVPLAVRQAALANGHTVYIDLFTGNSKHGLENMFWISPLAHELTIEAVLGTSADVIYDPANQGVNITNKDSLIQSFDLILNPVTVDEDARAIAIAMHNSDEGLYNLIFQPLLWSFNIPATTNGLFEFPFRETRHFNMLTIFFECEDKTVGWQREPFDIQGPTMTDLGGNTVTFPTEFELIGGSSTHLIKRRTVAVHRIWEHAHRFVDREPNDWILNVPFAYIDPLKDNTIMNPIGPDVYNQLRLRLYWPGAVATGGSGARVTLVLHTNNFINNANSDACLLIC